MNQPLLTIAIPTLNRLELLKGTINALLSQVIPFQNEVEFIVLNNASDDGTEEWLESNFTNHPIIKYYNFKDRADIVGSISRCIETGQGEYIWIFGDDDLPMPFALATILSQLKNQNTDSKHGFFYFNCIRGDRHLNNYINLFEYKIELNPRVYDLDSFLSTFNLIHLGFITAIVFKRENCFKTWTFYSDSHYGYNFLTPILSGCKGVTCLYYSFPLIINRLGPQRYVRKWPQYILIGIPNILLDLFKNGIVTKKPYEQWQSSQSFLAVLKSSILAKAYDYDKKNPFWIDAINHQKGLNRTSMVLIRNLVPQWLSKIIFETFADNNTPKAT